MEKWWIVSYDTREYKYVYAKVYAKNRREARKILNSHWGGGVTINWIEEME